MVITMDPYICFHGDFSEFPLKVDRTKKNFKLNCRSSWNIRYNFNFFSVKIWILIAFSMTGIFCGMKIISLFLSHPTANWCTNSPYKKKKILKFEQNPCFTICCCRIIKKRNLVKSAERENLHVQKPTARK